MRRLTVLLVVVVAVVSACGNDEGKELPNVLERWGGALAGCDAAAMAALYTEDGVHHDHGRSTPQTWEGRGSIESAFQGACTYLTLAETELLSAERTGDTIVTRWRWSGTSGVHSRPAADQSPFTAEMESVFVLHGDLIASSEFTYEYSSVFN